MTKHRFDKGNRVAIISNGRNGMPLHEGNATVTARVDVDDYYTVRFDGEPDATYDRFAFVAPGNEADDYLEELRVQWRHAKARAVAS